MDQQELAFNTTVAAFEVLWKATGRRNNSICLGAYKELLNAAAPVIKRDTINVWSAIARHAKINISKDEIMRSYDSSPERALGIWMDENREALSSLTKLKLSVLTILPPEIWRIEVLQDLNFSCNLLIALPSGIGQLKALQVLYLNGNRFTVFPREIVQIQTLQKLTFERNQLNVPYKFNDLVTRLILRFIKITDEYKNLVYNEIYILAIQDGVEIAEWDHNWAEHHIFDDADHLEQAMNILYLL